MAGQNVGDLHIYRYQKYIFTAMLFSLFCVVPDFLCLSKTTFTAKEETKERTTGNHSSIKFTDEHFAEHTLCFLVLSVVANTCNRKLVENKEGDLQGGGRGLSELI